MNNLTKIRKRSETHVVSPIIANFFPLLSINLNSLIKKLIALVIRSMHIGKKFHVRWIYVDEIPKMASMYGERKIKKDNNTFAHSQVLHTTSAFFLSFAIVQLQLCNQ